METSIKIHMLEVQLEYALPDTFKALMACTPSSLTFCRKGKRWKFQDSAGLLSTVQIGHFQQPYYKQLLAFAAIMGLEQGGNLAIEGRGLFLSTQELCSSIAVADENGDILFLNPQQNFSVWVFYHDGAYVEKEAENLTNWLLSAECEVEPMVDVHREASRVQIGIEDAIHFYVSEILIPRGKLKWEDFFRREHGQVVWRPEELATVEELVKLVTLLQSLKPQEERAQILKRISDLSKSA